MLAGRPINTIIKPLVRGIFILNISIVAMTNYMLFSSKQRFETQVSTYTQNLAHTLEGYISGIYQNIDASLLLTAHKVAQSDITTHEFANDIQLQLQNSLFLSSIVITNKRGYISYSYPPANDKTNITLSEQANFKAQKTRSNSRMTIGKATFNVHTQQWELPFTHRINNPDGSFNGIIKATVPLSKFEYIFSNIDLGLKGVIELRDADLGLIKRHPLLFSEKGKVGSRSISLPMQQAIEKNLIQGTYASGPTSIDHINRISSYKKFKHYPFYITVGFAEDDYLSDWYQQVKTTVLLLIIFIVMSIILSFFLIRLLHKQQAIKEELIASEQLHKTEQNLLHSVMSNIPDLVWYKDLNGVYVFCNPRFESFFGALRDDIVGKTDYDFVEKTVADSFRFHDKRTLDAASPTTNEEHVTFHDGHSELLETTKTPVRDSEGNVIGILGIGHNITNRKQSELREKFRSRLLELITQTYSLTEIFNSVVDEIEQQNKNMQCSILLLDDEGKRLRTGAAPSLPSFYNAAIDGIEIGLGVGSCGTAAFTGQQVIVDNIESHPYWQPYLALARKASIGSCWSQPILSSQGKVLGTFAIYHHEPHSPSESDIKLIEQTANLVSIAIEKIRSEEQLKLAATVFSHAGESITITDTEGVILNINRAFTRITGYEAEDVLGKKTNILKSGQQSAEFYDELWHSLTEKGYWHGEVWNRRKNGEVYAEMKTISAVHNTQGVVTNYVALCTDITPVKEHQLELEHMAQYDVLTDLPNRSLLNDRLSQAIVRSQRDNTLVAVIFLDLDGFKNINDMYGHEKGDELLITLAKFMHDALREGDTLARFGGDEFVAILTDLESIEDCDPILKRLLQAASMPTTLNEPEVQVTASIGVTFYPHDNDDADLLLRHADQAMYIAKQSGKNRYHIFDTEQDIAIKTKRQSIEQIRFAMNNDEFVLHYQPKVNMRTGNVIGVEALIRWQHPERGLLSPSEFLPIIENDAISFELGQWVLETALSQISYWKSLGKKSPESVSVNISALQLQQDNFADNIVQLLAAHPDINPENLELEVLETSALENVPHVSAVMNRCMALGVKFALDDFGTGYSSLTYLRRLPANTIKIDQSFVRDMLNDTDDLAIVEGVIALSKSFKRDVIAEGVETKEHGSALLQLGCELAQGYGIAKPMPAEEIPDWVNNWKPNDSWRA